MASVTPRTAKDGTVTWRVQFRIDGRMCQETFMDVAGAQQFGDLVDKVGGRDARAVLEARRGKGAGVPTLREWAARYLDEDSGLLTGIEPATRRDYGRIADRSFLQVLGDYPVDAIGRAEVGKWVAWQERQLTARPGGEGPLSAKTVKNYHALLSSMLGAAVDHVDTVTANAAHKTRLSRGMRHPPVFLSPTDFRTLVTFIPDRYVRLAWFLAGTGARWGEATALTWGDLNLRSSPATVRIDKAWKKSTGASLLKHPKTSRSNRTISLWPDLVQRLGEPGPSGDLLFPSTVGRRIWPSRFWEGAWTPAIDAATDPERCAELGLDPIPKRPRIHDLRHSHASWLIAAGAPLPFIQARLGHESITTTIGTYGHLLPDAHEQMSAMMAATLAEPAAFAPLAPVEAVEG